MSETEHEHEHDEDEPISESVQPVTPEELAEEDEQPGEQQPDEQQPDEQPEALDPKAIEKIFGRLDSEASRHAKRLGEILAEEAQELELCPCCGPVEGLPNLPGFVMAGMIPPEAQDRMREALGLGATGHLKTSPYSDPCDICEGWGVLETRSHVPNMDIETCQKCTGRGYVPKGTAAGAPLLEMPNGTEHMTATPSPASLGPEPPEAAALRARGYAVIPPIQPATA